jgi:predicted metal-dependent HD superfamily phosphohydrolase
MALQHFLLVYDLGAQRLIKQQEFGDGDEAAAAYAALERHYKDRDDLEIVLVGADSIETIKRTHAHYFDAVETASPFLAGV